MQTKPKTTFVAERVHWQDHYRASSSSEYDTVPSVWTAVYHSTCFVISACKGVRGKGVGWGRGSCWFALRFRTIKWFQSLFPTATCDLMASIIQYVNRVKHACKSCSRTKTDWLLLNLEFFPQLLVRVHLRVLLNEILHLQLQISLPKY